MYGTRKRGPTKGGSPAPDSVPQTPEPPHPKELAPEPELEPEPTLVEKAAQEVPDNWEAPSEEEKAPQTTGVKDSWDDSSEEDEEGPAHTPEAAAKAASAKGLLISICSSLLI